MKALFIDEHGGPEVLKIGELPEPAPGYGEVLVRVKACALNHLDIWVRKGLPGLKLSFPHVMGSDIAGIVEAIGEGVSSFKPGDRVTANPGVSCGKCEYCLKGEHSLCPDFKIIGEHMNGVCAEYAVIPETNLLKFPEDFTFEEMAGVPLVFLTAWRMLMTRAKIRAGEKVLIVGGSGGVATAALQIAKLGGATVYVTTSSDGKAQKLRELGADEVILDPDFHRAVWNLTEKRGVDAVVDSVGEATWGKSLRSLKRGGRLVTCGATTGSNPPAEIRYIFWRQISVIGSTMASQWEFREVMDLIFQRKLQPVIGTILPLKKAREAHELLEERKHFGKIVLIID